jgi:hypothetical protein
MIPSADDRRHTGDRRRDRKTLKIPLRARTSACVPAAQLQGAHRRCKALTTALARNAAQRMRAIGAHLNDLVDDPPVA